MRAVLCAITIGMLFPLPICAQGTLDAVRADVRADQEEDEHDEKHRSAKHRHCDDDDDDWFLGLGGITILGGAPRARKPVRTIEYREVRNPDGSVERQKIVYENGVTYEETVEAPTVWGFPPYPYPYDLPGYMQIDPTPIGHLTGNKDETLILKWWSLRLALEDGWDFDDLNRFNGHLQAETLAGLGLYTSWNWFTERRRCGCTDDAVIGNITGTWRIIDTKYVLFRAGIGAWIYTDDYITDSGGNFHLSADIFPQPPWVVSTILEFGGIGDTGLFHIRGTVGYLFAGAELYAGYDFLQIGNTNLQGPLIGLRVWF